MNRRVYTIGYSPFSPEGFMDMLRLYDITTVCDVRSMPYSRYRPEFNRDVLEERLVSCGMEYHFLGAMLGGRPAGEEVYEDGRVRFDRLAATGVFQQGLTMLREIVMSRTAALTCAEKDPLTCHRTILVCRQIRGEFDIRHILEDGSLESHHDAERRLVKQLNIPTDDLFRTEEELISDAYDLQGRKIAYTKRQANDS